MAKQLAANCRLKPAPLPIQLLKETNGDQVPLPGQ